MTRSTLAFLGALLLLFAMPLAQAQRRRSADLLLSDHEAAQWLERNALVLNTTAFPAPNDDLEPLHAILGGASIVMLADATHGTHEFYTLKLRMIEFLVREMGFDVIALEAPFAPLERLNRYVQNGDGDPRAILADLYDRLYYRFWEVQEIVELIEWLRAYNAARGTQPPVELVGFDSMDPRGAADAVLEFLNSVDPASGTAEQREYACLEDPPSWHCELQAKGVRDRLLARRAELAAVAGSRSLEDALHHAEVVVQSFRFPVRDEAMAENLLWVREHRGRRVVAWAHQEHAGKTDTPWVGGGRSMGGYLSRALGDEYVVIGTLTGGGLVRLWDQVTGTTSFVSFASPVPSPVPGSHESMLALHPAPAILVPLKGTLPSWLQRRAPFFTLGQAPGPMPRAESLPAMLDAVVFIETTTPTIPLR